MTAEQGRERDVVETRKVGVTSKARRHRKPIRTGVKSGIVSSKVRKQKKKTTRKGMRRNSNFKQ